MAGDPFDAWFLKIFGVDPGTFHHEEAAQGPIPPRGGAPAGSAQSAGAGAAPAGSGSGKPLLMTGAKGKDVKELQGLLNKHGATLTEDGDFGTLTEQAVREFQGRSPPLVADGKAGDKTWAALASATPDPPAPPDPPDAVLRKVIVIVTDAASNDAVDGAAVSIGDQSETTGNTGQATLSLPPGRHGFDVTAQGFAPSGGDVTVTTGDTTELRVELTGGAARSVSITPDDPPAMAPGGQRQFSATDETGRDVSRTVAWTSSDPKILSIDQRGLAIAGSVPGTARITAAPLAITASAGAAGRVLAAAGRVLAMVSVTVSAPQGPGVMVKITVVPGDAILPPGIVDVPNDMNFKAIGEFSNGPPRDVSNEVTWAVTSTPAGAVTISLDGKAFVSGVGSAVITATNPANTQVTAAATLTAPPSNLVPTLKSMTIEPAVPAPLTDKPLQLKAVGTFSDGSVHEVTQDVTWTSSDPNTIEMDNALGGLAVPGPASGRATITATHSNRKIRPASVNLTVAAPPQPPIAGLSRITVAPPNPSIPVGSPQRFTAMGGFANGPDQDVTTKVRWSCSDAKVAVIGQRGIAAGKAAGTVTITATDPNSNGQVSGSTGFTVFLKGHPPVLQSITVSPGNPTVTDFNFVQFTAMGTFSDGLDRSVDAIVGWITTSPSINIGLSGIAAPVASGVALIVAVDPATNVSGGTNVTLVLPALVKVTVSPQTLSVTAGDSAQLVADGEFADGTSHTLTTVTWSSSNQDADVDPSGLVTGKTQGAAVITAVDTATRLSDAANVTVTPPVLRKITVTTNDPRLPKGRPVQLTATGEFSDGHTEDVSTAMTWESSSADVVVSTNGTAVGQNPGGKAELSATDPDDSRVTASIAVTVVAPALNGISVRPNGARIAVGKTVQFTALGEFSDGPPPRDITTQVQWTADPPGIISIDPSGRAEGLAAGRTNLSVTDPVSRTTFRTVVVEVGN